MNVRLSFQKKCHSSLNRCPCVFHIKIPSMYVWIVTKEKHLEYSNYLRILALCIKAISQFLMEEQVKYI
ncbi:hypothetical protein MHBO_002927 [Bonamia ostreae]|uniref:Uncharacterized protein n=1 Tax=Bonamia ostreae TaxID=126728 RepID=A0ABV2ANZ0_9EUKA